MEDDKLYTGVEAHERIEALRARMIELDGRVTAGQMAELPAAFAAIGWFCVGLAAVGVTAFVVAAVVLGAR